MASKKVIELSHSKLDGQNFREEVQRLRKYVNELKGVGVCSEEELNKSLVFLQTLEECDLEAIDTRDGRLNPEFRSVGDVSRMHETITIEEARTIKNVLLRLGCDLLLGGEVCDAALNNNNANYFRYLPSVVAFLSEAASKVGDCMTKKDITGFLNALPSVNETLYLLALNDSPLFQIDEFLQALFETLQEHKED